MRLDSSRHRIHAAAIRLFVERDTTQWAVSDLAAAAGMARGTVYYNLPDPQLLFREVAERLANEMAERLQHGFRAVEDPALQLSHAVRQYVRRAHDEPDWGRFMTHFAHSCWPLHKLRAAWLGDKLRADMQHGRYCVRPNQSGAIMGMVAGTVIGAMAAAREGELTWPAAGSEMAQMLLVALGLEQQEARAIASATLPPLPQPLKSLP